MARARNIKPSLFKNEVLGVADPLLTLLFEGLWCLADCNGVLEDRPLRIKAEIFPYREISDLNIFLTELEMWGFINRYFHANTPLIEVVNFKKHQKPHPTEKASEWPCLLDADGISEISDLNVKKNGNILFKQPSSLIPSSLIPDSPLPAVDTAATKKSVSKKGTRIPTDFIVTDEMRSWFIGKGFTFGEPTETEKFVNHWTGKSGQNALKIDWVATWRNWMLNAQDYKGGFPVAAEPKPVDENIAKGMARIKAQKEMSYVPR